MLRPLIILAGALAIAQAQTVTALHSFGDGTDGYEPNCTLTEVSPGVFIGTTVDTIFGVTSSGAFKNLYTFNANTQGGYTLGQLYPASNGVLYGANDSGNGSYTGSLFAVAKGKFQLLQSDSYLASPLIEASDGNLYGVEGDPTTGNFEVFRMDRTGAITSVYNLGPNAQSFGPLFQASDGNLYGMTLGTGPGTIFKLSLNGRYSLLHTFKDGEGGVGGLMEASNGLLYGVAANAFTNVQCPEIGSFIFSLSLSGEFKRYENFGGCPGGISVPPVITGLMEASDGNLYGAAQETGGFGQNGVIFQMSLDGAEFHPILDMSLAYGVGPGGQNGAGLIQGSDGALYGTARNGGTYQFGTVFRIDLGLTTPLPVVSYIMPGSAAANSSVIIAGQHLLGVTEVSFNGVPAATVTSEGPNYVEAVVPPGATSGPVTVTTPNGSVTSKFNFTVQ